MQLEKQPLFNPEGKEVTTLLGEAGTGLRNWNKTRYPWSKKQWDIMVDNYWTSKKVPLGEDKTTFQTLEGYLKRIFKKIISFLNYLDSVQSDNLPYLAAYLSSWEVKSLLNVQGFQEEIHAESYSKVLKSVCGTDEEIHDIINEWRNDHMLRERNVVVSSYYQEFIDNQNVRSFVKACMANYILESIFFYSGFTFFYYLADNGLMMQTAQMIKYIQKDELTHVALFGHMITALQAEQPEIFTEEFVEELRDMMKLGVEWEIKWGQHMFNNEVAGISDKALEMYIKYLSNKRLKRIGFEVLYPEVTDNPFKWVEKWEDPNNIKEDFFEVGAVTNYQLSSEDQGWDDL